MLTPRLAARTLLAVTLSLAVAVPVGAALTGCGPKVIREPTLTTPPGGAIDGAAAKGAPQAVVLLSPRVEVLAEKAGAVAVSEVAAVCARSDARVL